MICYILLFNAHFSQSYQFQMAKIKSYPIFFSLNIQLHSYNGKCMTFQKLKELWIQVYFKCKSVWFCSKWLAKKKKNLFQTGTSPNDFISDKLVTSRDNETDSETDKKGMRQENRNKRGQTGTWSLKDMREFFFLFFFFLTVFYQSSPESPKPFIKVWNSCLSLKAKWCTH